jgi:peptidylprolyl isomerase
MRNLTTIVALVALTGLVGCGDDGVTETSHQAERIRASGDVPTASEAASRQAWSSSAKAILKRPQPKVAIPKGKPPTQLVVENLIEGNGEVAEDGDELSVVYVAVEYETGELFENSWGFPFGFELGSGAVNDGWEIGLEGMRVGGRRELVVPPKLAPYAEDALVYVVDLVEVKKPSGSGGR